MSVYEAPITNGLHQIVAAAIGNNSSETELDSLFDEITNFTAVITDSIQTKEPPVKNLACGEGCSHCCYQYDIGASPLEVIRIAEYINENFSDDEHLSLLEKLSDAEDKKKHFPIEDWGIAKFPCPLLVDDSCSVYQARPLVCRAMNSYSAKRCRDNHEHPRDDSTVPMYGHQYDIAKFARTGIRLGLYEAGLQFDLLELVPALRIALSTPGARLRWLAGEPIFAEAVSCLPQREKTPKKASNDSHFDAKLELSDSVKRAIHKAA